MSLKYPLSYIRDYLKEHYDIYLNDPDAFAELCNSGLFENKVDWYGANIWHYLARSGNYIALTKAIDDKRCDPKITNEIGTTIWHYLAWSGKYGALTKAIDENRFDPKIINNFNLTIWYYFAKTENYSDLIKAIDSKRFDINILPNCMIKKIEKYKELSEYYHRILPLNKDVISVVMSYHYMND
jgi:hypothetical protein